MKIDLYTKSVLTVIAVCLLFFVLQDIRIIPTANALTDDILPASYSVIPINDDGSINVRLISTDEIDVNISDISTDDELNVNIEEVGGTRLYYGDGIPVEIE